MSRTRHRRAILSGLVAASLLILTLGSTAGAQTLRPTPAAAPHDYEKLWHDGCFGFAPDTKPQAGCVFGDTTSTYKVVIVGDSHTSDFFPAFNRIAKARHWKLYTYVKADCPFIDIPIRNAADMSNYPQCTQWNSYVLGRLQRLKPDLTITIPFRWIIPVDASQASPTATGAAIGRMLAQISGLKVVIVDSPFSNRDVPSCVAAHGAAACAIPRSQVLSGGVNVREHKAAEVSGGFYINLTPKFCPSWPCRVVTNGILEFRDSHHLTATYTASLTPIVDEALQRVLH
jgi:hypothetical protein